MEKLKQRILKTPTGELRNKLTTVQLIMLAIEDEMSDEELEKLFDDTLKENQ